MAQQEPPLGIPQQDWANTPKSVQILVETLLSMVGELQQTIPPLQKRIDQLEEKLGKNSRNSSKPPSSDAPNHKKPPPKPKKGRKRGGQVGHEGHSRALKPIEEVNRVIVSKPSECQHCGALLLGYDFAPQRHQVCELCSGH